MVDLDLEKIPKYANLTSDMAEAGAAVINAEVGGADVGGLFDAFDLACRVFLAMVEKGQISLLSPES